MSDNTEPLLPPDHPCYDPEDPAGAHDWQYKSDWFGDPGVINGTQDIYWRVCARCGAEEDLMSDDMPMPDDDYGEF